MEITREDIDRVAEIMGKDFSDTERTDVIQCMDCCDVSACPGSGKTTTMVAKLLILSEKLAGTMTGICALSHTNAAKYEIEKILGPHSGALMRHPHFVGTIQVFTDMFLAIPAYIEEFGRRPVAIDDELYENVAKRYYPRIQWKIRFALDRHTRNAGQELFCNTSYGFSNFELVNFDSNRETAFYCQTTTQTYREVLRWKQELTSLGYLTYHDAFSYANRYIRKYPNFTTIISNRFSYVFIDEMQDTDTYQNELIETIFRGRSTIQKFGDPNQTIYGLRSQGGEPIWRPQGNHFIRSSRRLSPSISRLSQGICSQSHEIRGNDQIPNHSHTVILFDQRRREDVIPRFGQIIEDEQLREGPFKALGAIGRPNQNPDLLSITSYWPSFQRRLQQNRDNNPFWGLVHQAHYAINLTNKYSDAYQLLSRA
ncbi:MAG: UvrD-helicase domain-containing protein, partial [Bacteroidetes bacterium]|nr:UvrD-helicase domain-containing protein [Bacteroidota bacterium]